MGKSTKKGKREKEKRRMGDREREGEKKKKKKNQTICFDTCWQKEKTTEDTTSKRLQQQPTSV